MRDPAMIRKKEAPPAPTMTGKKAPLPAKKAAAPTTKKAVTKKAVTKKAVTKKAVTKKAVTKKAAAPATKKAATKKAATKKARKAPAEEATTAWEAFCEVLNTGALELIDTLLRLGYDPNTTDEEGFTTFMSAVCADRRGVPILKRLVEAGADPKAVTDLGYNAFHAAVGMEREHDGDEATVRAILGYLAELGVPIELRNQRGHTALARALIAGTEIEVRLLCELGANPGATAPSLDVKNAEEPVIFHAIDSERDAAGKVAALVKAGAELKVRDAQGLTPAQRASFKVDEAAVPGVLGALG
jgi:hypothetical protein